MLRKHIAHAGLPFLVLLMTGTVERSRPHPLFHLQSEYFMAYFPLGDGKPSAIDTADVRFSAVRSLQFSILSQCGYCTKWRIQGRSPRKSILTLDSFRYVLDSCLFLAICVVHWEIGACTRGAYIKFHRVLRPWRRTLTNGNDVKYVLPRCLRNFVEWLMASRCNIGVSSSLPLVNGQIERHTPITPQLNHWPSANSKKNRGTPFSASIKK